VAALLGDLAVGIHAGAVMHTPIGATEEAVQVARELAADAVVAIGGGSTTGLGKAVALRTDLPQIVLPTTYAGSEMTPILGETKHGAKTTLRTLKVLPEVVIYDVDLTMRLPPAIAATSGMNAMTHAVEALYAKDRNPMISLMAEEGLAALAHALPRITGDPQNRAARSDALYGALLCGTCLGSVCMALHHKLCHVLGGAFNLPHAETTRSFYRMQSPTTLWLRLMPWCVSRRPWAQPTRPGQYSSWRGALEPRRRCATSACRRTELSESLN
jgi:alcohol dehydrogenase class IV